MEIDVACKAMSFTLKDIKTEIYAMEYRFYSKK